MSGAFDEPGRRIQDADERQMVEGLDRALGRPARRTAPAGEVLLQEGEVVEGIWIVESGQVRLTRRADSREVVLDSGAAGPIIGLLSIAERGRAFFSCTAVTDVTGLFVPWDDLDRALQGDAALSAAFVRVLVRSLANRLRRTVELQVEVEELNEVLAAERDQLAAALKQLEQAQGRLVSSEKMAMLGQLSAGIAHELNNPVTAIRRGVDFVVEDVSGLIGKLPEREVIEAALRNALESGVLSTRELRERREALELAVGDAELARRLMGVGITTAAEHERWFSAASAGEAEQRLAVMERIHQLGISMRNIRTSGERIAAIVKSLRSYARPGEAAPVEADLHEGLEDTLLLFGPQLRGIEVERRYGEIPRVECRVGQINQVWTNLISNALDAMAGKGVLTIETEALDGERVRVRIIDSGPGIPPENLGRVFELNFTTKRGQTKYGLGMGLVISRQIVARHGGTIEIESRPGRTSVAVTLPVKHPWLPREG